MEAARNLIWHELGDAKTRELYLSKLITRKRYIVKCYSVIALVFSTSGVFGWNVWKPYPAVVCAGLAVMSLLNLVQPQIIPNDKELAALNKFSNFYCQYFREVEKLWIRYYNDKVTNDDAIREFYAIKESEQSINNEVDEIHHSRNKKLAFEASNEALEYLKKIHLHE